MANKPKSIGTNFESQVVKYLQSKDLDAYRIALAGGSDKGDVHVRRHDGRVTVIEAKSGKQANCCSPAQERTWFAECQREAANVGAAADVGVLVLKRKGSGQARAGDHEVVIDLGDLNHLFNISSRYMAAITVRVRLGELAAALKMAGY